MLFSFRCDVLYKKNNMLRYKKYGAKLSNPIINIAKRIRFFQMKYLAVLNVVGLTPRLIGKHTPNIERFFKSSWSSSLIEPFPAVTCTSQSTMLTGLDPSEHGIVGNGWYFKDLAEVGFWKQSNGLVEGAKVWEVLKEVDPKFTCAKIFWWYNMYSSADYSVTPRPHYPADGRKIFDIYTYPEVMGNQLKSSLGNFPFMNFWGPKAGIESSEWIAQSAKQIFENYSPNLNLVYLPHLDYCLQKFAHDSQDVSKELEAIDKVVGDLINFYKSNNVDVMIVSEYGLNEVDTVVHPNRILRENGFVKVRKSLSWELLDCGACDAFAVSDHQICHIYVKNKIDIPRIIELFEKEGNQKRVLHGDQLREYGLNHKRSGDIVLMANSNAWYSYYYWLDDKRAPDFARCIDIHRKPGYDPVELFFDPAIKFPMMKILWKLLKKKLGFRVYMDFIPLTPDLVRGSHGAPSETGENRPLVISDIESINPVEKSIPMKSIYSLIKKYFD